MIRAIKNECFNILKKKDNRNLEIKIDYRTTEEKEDNTLEKVLNLPDKYKVPIYLFYYEGYDAIEISKILKINVNTIYSYLNRGRNLLKIEIEGEMS